MLEMGSHCTGQNDGFQIATFSRQIGDGIPMADSGDFLVQDRTLVEILGHIVSGGSDDLHPSVMSLTIGIGTDESREERVVDIDDSGSICIDDEGRENLHVSGKNDEIHVVTRQFSENFALLFESRLRSDGKVAVGDPHVFDQIRMIGVIVDHAHDVGRELSRSPSAEEVEKTVRLSARQDGDAWSDVRESKLCRHGELRRNGFEGVENLMSGNRHSIEFELHALEEDPLDVVGVLLGVDDVSSVGRDESGNGCHHTFAIRARDQQNSSCRHSDSLPGEFALLRPTMKTSAAEPLEPLLILSAGTTIDESGVSFPTLVVDVSDRPDVGDLAGIVAEQGMGDLHTSAEVGLDTRGRGIIRLMVSATRPVPIEFSLVFPLPAYTELLTDAARMGCLVIAAAHGSGSAVRAGEWLGIDLDGASLARLVAFAG